MSRLFRHPKKAFTLFIFTVALIALFAYYNETGQRADFTTAPLAAAEGDPILTDKGADHILVGDENSGGHRFGAGRPCKSEFPEEWDDAKILDTVKKIAANDNLPWEQQKNGYYVAQSEQEGVKVKVVLNRDRTKIITGYPTNRIRNPCVRATNDNIKSEPAPTAPD